MNAIPETAALAEFELILASAYGTMDGPQQLDAVIDGTVQIGVFRDLGTKFTPMKLLVHGLREQLVARGPDDFHKCVEALYRDLPGSEALRTWVQQYQPDSLALVADDVFQRERGPFIENRTLGRQKLVISGFDALLKSRGQAFIAAEIDSFKGKLTDATHQLQLLNGYKQLHDNLHVIQTQVLARFSRILLKSEIDEFDIQEIRELNDVVAAQVPKAEATIRMFLDDETTEEERKQNMLPLLRAAVAPLKDGDLSQPDTLRGVTAELRGVLRMHLPRLNRKLSDAAGAIPFVDLSKLLRRAADRAEAAGSPVEARLEDAAAALDDIGARLKRMVSAHGIWQDIDSALWLMEGNVRRANDPDSRLELVATWRNALSRVDALEELDPEGVAILRASAKGFQDQLNGNAGDAARMASAFHVYSGQVRVRFFMIDTALLNECAAVAKLEPTLKALSEGD